MFFSILNKDLKSFIYLALCVFLAIFPFLFNSNYFFYGTTSRSINLFIFTEILILICGVIILYKQNRVSIFKSPVTLSLLLFFVVSFISAVQGIDFLTSFWSKLTRTTGLFYFIHAGFLYLILVGFVNEEKRLNTLIKTFLISAGLFSIGSLLSNDGLSLMFTGKTWNGFTFGNSSFAAMYLYAAFLLSVYIVSKNTEKIKKWWYYFVPLVFVINPYFINTNVFLGKVNILSNPSGVIGEAQASSIAMFVSVFLLIIFWATSKVRNLSVRKKIIWFFVGSGLLVTSIFINSFLSTGGYLREVYLSQASNARPLVWELSKKSIEERPLLGWGIDNFDRAFEKNYDNRILEEKNGAEAWFDRAHNIFIDQTVEGGYIGLFFYILLYIVVIACLLYVVFKSKIKNDQTLAVILIVYFLGHLMELQTGFDTSISYFALIIMLVVVTVLFHKTFSTINPGKTEYLLPLWAQRFLGIFLISTSLFLMILGTIPITRSQNASGKAHMAGSTEKRIDLYPVVFGSPLDTATMLWRTLHDFQRGIAEKSYLLEDQTKKENFAKELAVFTEVYRRYANSHPHDYRVRVSLAGAYIYERLLGVDHLNEAHVVLDDAINISPNIPQAYWMKSVVYLYQAKFDLAREWAKKAQDLNPEVEQSQKIIDYIEQSIKTFPDINFFTFSQI